MRQERIFRFLSEKLMAMNDRGASFFRLRLTCVTQNLELLAGLLRGFPDPFYMKFSSIPSQTCRDEQAKGAISSGSFLKGRASDRKSIATKSSYIPQVLSIILINH